MKDAAIDLENRGVPHATSRGAIDLVLAAWPDPVIVIDRNGDARSPNADVVELATRLDLDAVRDAASRALLTGKIVRFETGRRGLAGPIAWFQGTAWIDPGRCGIALVALTDVTARVQTEERLRRSEQLLVDVQGTAHLGTWEWNLTEPNATWSPELYRIYGLDPATHVPTYDAYLARVHPEDRQRVIDATNTALRDRIPYAHDERVYRADGELRYLRTWGQIVLDDDGEVARLIGVCQDITDIRNAELRLEQSESRMRALFDRSPVGIASLDPATGVVCEANAALATKLGRTDLVGRVFDTFVHPEDVVPAADALFGVDREPVRFECRLIRGDGTPFRARLTWAPVAQGGVGAPFAIVVVEDVSARVLAEEATRIAELRRVRIEELEEVSGWKDQVLRIASHELRNPLMPMGLQIQMLQRGRFGALNERQQRSVDLIRRQSDSLTTLVRDVLDVARLQAGQLATEREQVDVAVLASDVIDALRSTAEQNEVAITVTRDGATATSADAGRVRQVLFNLLGNALKLTCAGSTVRVSVGGGDDGVAVRIADAGPGLSDEQRRRLFLPFTRVHVDRHERERGTGLGLYISKAIVDAHGGEIGVDSDGPGLGATFWFRLPTS